MGEAPRGTIGRVAASSPAALTVVFLHAHPDDEASRTSGTMRLLADAGHRVVVAYATNGDHGTSPEDLEPGETLVDRRRAEAEASAEVTGAQAVHWLGYADSGMTGWDQNAHETSFHSADASAAAGNPFGTHEAEIHWEGDVTDQMPVKRRALECHASQTSDVGFMLSLPAEAFAEWFGTEFYAEPGRAPGLVSATWWE